MSATGGRATGSRLSGELSVLIVRLIADAAHLSATVDAAIADLEAQGVRVAGAAMLQSGAPVMELDLPDAGEEAVRAVLDRHFAPSDVLIADHPPVIPHLFISDMDSTMIGQECIDELADFANLKPQIAAITERAMQGELDFASALRERVLLLKGLSETAITRCLDERIAPMAGAATLVATLKAHGCRTVLVTGGFHQFADPVADMLGFEHVVANRLEVADGALTGGLVGPICDSSTKLATLIEEAAAIGTHARSLATGDGANDIPMIAAASYGVAYHAKPKARAAANGWVDRGDLTAVLHLLGIPARDWVN
ncbi:MAG: phosphoserine phosphatase SerB [Sphingomonadales bacterium]|nr:phosphoserine phosphatase SerB [Sphingomonadales bacterium]